jgi:hypothetical protein
VLSENSPSCRAKKGLSGSPHEPRNTAWHAISIHKLGLYPLDWLWRPPQAAELLGAACGGLLALISRREIKPSSPGLDPSNALRSSAAYGQLDPTPWGPRALDPPVAHALMRKLGLSASSTLPAQAGEQGPQWPAIPPNAQRWPSEDGLVSATPFPWAV